MVTRLAIAGTGLNAIVRLPACGKIVDYEIRC